MAEKIGFTRHIAQQLEGVLVVNAFLGTSEGQSALNPFGSSLEVDAVP